MLPVCRCFAERSDALIILGIILTSALLSFRQENRAARAVTGLLALVQVTARVRRDGQVVEVAADTVVPGDVVELSAGSSLPADARLRRPRISSSTRRR